MSTPSERQLADRGQGRASGMAARAAQVGVMFLIQGIALFWAAGRLAWVWGWVFLVIYVLSVLINSVFMLRTSPDTIAERGRPKEMRNWDKLVGGLWGVVHFVALPVVAGLDVRLGWTNPPSIGWHVAGAMGFGAGLGLFGWAMITNAYFSTVVRIQADRGQTVCRDGPYRALRHPGYLGAIVQSLAIPLLLGSWWSFIAGATAMALMVIRTSLEDRTLKAELPGYSEYAAQVKHRLVPGVW